MNPLLTKYEILCSPRKIKKPLKWSKRCGIYVVPFLNIDQDGDGYKGMYGRISFLGIDIMLNANACRSLIKDARLRAGYSHFLYFTEVMNTRHDNLFFIKSRLAWQLKKEENE